MTDQPAPAPAVPCEHFKADGAYPSRCSRCSLQFTDTDHKIAAAVRADQARQGSDARDQPESLARQHIRKQEHANGFQEGWHAALTRTADTPVAELRELVPCPPTHFERLEQAEAETAALRAQVAEWQFSADLARAQAQVTALREGAEQVRRTLGSLAELCDSTSEGDIASAVRGVGMDLAALLAASPEHGEP